MKFFLLCLLMCLPLTGCPSHSGVVPIGPDTFMISKQAATGFTGLGNLKAEVMKEGNNYCHAQSKEFEIVNTWESSPPYLLGNYPRVEIHFMCLDVDSKELIA